MELEAFKQIWKANMEKALAEEQVGGADIRSIIRQRSLDSWQRIRRNILWEAGLLLACVLASVGLAVWAGIAPGLPLLGLAGGFLLLGLLFYGWKYRLISRFNMAEHNLYQTLLYLTRTLRLFMRLYRLLIFVLLPLLGTTFFLLGLQQGALLQGGSWAGITPAQWGVAAAALLLYLALMLGLARWHVHRLYGRYYQQLLACLKELEEVAGK
ncbi:MAG: hypothetical protein D6730_15200 [Bacteroidetes bacterium]|nr:MAG: hypothetical protein D6730_15200 [Bacteroidota bacterium]